MSRGVTVFKNVHVFDGTRFGQIAESYSADVVILSSRLEPADQLTEIWNMIE